MIKIVSNRKDPNLVGETIESLHHLGKKLLQNRNGTAKFLLDIGEQITAIPCLCSGILMRDLGLFRKPAVVGKSNSQASKKFSSIMPLDIRQCSQVIANCQDCHSYLVCFCLDLESI